MVRAPQADGAGVCLEQLARQRPCCSILFAGSSVTAALAGAVAMAFGAMVVVGILVALAHTVWFRTLVHDGERRRRQRARRRRYERRLALAGVPTTTLDQLDELVCDIERTSAVDAELYDVDGLLERYVALECEHARVEQALSVAELGRMTCALQTLPDSGWRRQVLEHRIALYLQARARADALRDAVETIDELVHAVAQRVAFAGAYELDTSCIDDCLERLAAEDDVARHLAA